MSEVCSGEQTFVQLRTGFTVRVEWKILINVITEVEERKQIYIYGLIS